MIANRVPIWKRAPFLRLLIPMIIGIILQWQFQWAVKVNWCVFSTSAILLFTGFLLPRFARFRWNALSGVAIGFVFLSLGSLLTWYKDVRHNSAWFGNYYNETGLISVRLTESPVEKTSSYKSVVSVTSLEVGGGKISTIGGLVVYFQKDSSV